MAKQGQGDAFALSHDSFAGLLPNLPGARVLPGNFQQTGIAIAVPKGRPVALKIASELLVPKHPAWCDARSMPLDFPKLRWPPNVRK